MVTTFKDRLLNFLDYLKIGQTKFEENTGLGRASISKIKDGMSSPNLAKIAKSYPELNIYWLITGEGSMLKEEPNATNYNNISGDNNNTHNIAGNIGTANTGNLNSLQSKEEIARLKKRIEELENNLKEKDELLANYKFLIETLKQTK